MMTPLALGVDLGSTQIRAAVVDRATGKIVSSANQPITDDKSPQALVSAMAKLMAKAEKQAGLNTPLPSGVAAAGQLRGNVVAVAPSLGWRDVPLADLLGKELGRPVRLVNDLKAAAWGELKVGAARGEAHSFTVFVGSGIGSAIISDGKIMMGAGGVAGELGHMKIVAENGRLCGCGERGCLEAYAGGANLELWMKEAKLTGRASALEEQAQAANAEAKKLWDFAASQLALVIANQVSVLNPGFVVLGGGVLTRSPRLVQKIIDTIGEKTSTSSREGLKVALASLGENSGAVGAALIGAEGY